MNEETAKKKAEAIMRWMRREAARAGGGHWDKTKGKIVEILMKKPRHA